jgi:hypothetical protein
MSNSNSKDGAEAPQSTKAEVRTSSSHNAKPNVTCRFLSVGDVVYGENRMYGIHEVLTIEKTTKTQGVCGDIRFKIDVDSNGKVKKIGQTYGWNTTSYYLETPELKEKYYRQNAVQKLKGFEYSKLSTEVLKELLSLVNGR